MKNAEVHIGEWMEKGFELYKANIVLLIITSFIAVVLSVATFGVLAGPMAVGLYLIILALLDKKGMEPAVGDIFKGFSYFLNSVLFILLWFVITIVGMIVLNVVPFIGNLAGSLFAFAVQVLLMFALFLIGDRKMDFWPASMESINTVMTNFWPFCGLYFISSLIGGLGIIAFGIGIIVTIPIAACIIAVAYRDVFGSG